MLSFNRFLFFLQNYVRKTKFTQSAKGSINIKYACNITELISRYHQENLLGNFLTTVQIIMIEGLMYGHDNYGMSQVTKSYNCEITIF